MEGEDAYQSAYGLVPKSVEVELWTGIYEIF